MSAPRLLPLRWFTFGLCVLLLGDGCESVEEWLEWPPPVSFYPYPIRHPLDLTRVLGQEVRLAGTQDTLELRIRYNPATHLNLLTHTTTGDTLQQVWATRHRQLYYFTWPINDTCYWVHAVRIRQGTVQGLTDSYHQISQLEEAIRAGRFPTVLQYQDSARRVLRLRFNQKALRKFYTAALDSAPVYRVITPHQLASPAAVAVGTLPPAATPLLQSMHPNPATDFVTLRLQAAGACEVAVFSATGKLALTATAPDTVCTVRLQQLPAGRYVVRVRETGTGRTGSRQLLIER